MSKQKMCERCEELPATRDDGYWSDKRWCDDCAVWLAEDAQERAFSDYHGGDGPRTDRERREVESREHYNLTREYK